MACNSCSKKSNSPKECPCKGEFGGSGRFIGPTEVCPRCYSKGFRTPEEVISYIIKETGSITVSEPEDIKLSDKEIEEIEKSSITIDVEGVNIVIDKKEKTDKIKKESKSKNKKTIKKETKKKSVKKTTKKK